MPWIFLTWTKNRSHFDCVRCLRFHANDPLLVTCSEDETIKLWNLSKTQLTTSKGKTATVNAATAATTFDLEPVYTFRGHHSRVLTLVVHGNTIFSGSQCGELFSWTIPENSANIDPYDPFDVSYSPTTFPGHSSAIWSLVCLEPLPSSKAASPLLVSASADNTIKVWDTSRRECIKSITFSGDFYPCWLQWLISKSNLQTRTSDQRVWHASITLQVTTIPQVHHP